MGHQIKKFLNSFRMYGQDIIVFLKGALTTAPYFFRFGEHRQEITECYPDPVASKTADDLPKNSRGLLFNDIDKCTGCKACQNVCPSKCIEIKVDEISQDTKLWVEQFDIDFAKCCFCSLCVDVCAPMSLIHTKQFEGAAYEAQDLIANFGRGKRI